MSWHNVVVPMGVYVDDTVILIPCSVVINEPELGLKFTLSFGIHDETFLSLFQAWQLGHCGCARPI